MVDSNIVQKLPNLENLFLNTTAKKLFLNITVKNFFKNCFVGMY